MKIKVSSKLMNMTSLDVYGGICDVSKYLKYKCFDNLLTRIRLFELVTELSEFEYSNIYMKI